MTGWIDFAAVLAAFFLSHSIPVRPRIRHLLVRALGERGFTIVYSLLSLGMLAAVIVAAGRAPFVLLWPQAPWQHHVVLTGMFVVCLILAFGLGQPNPFSFGSAHNDRFDPQHPGIVRWIRHPVLVGLGLWALLHMLPNGDLAHVILFGIFAGFAWVGRKIIDRRKQREMTRERWHAIQAEIKNSPPRKMRGNLSWVMVRSVLAVGVFALLLAFHSYVIGVSVVEF
ncbi:NnrU family protein [Sulfitobacter sp. F26204]|uniref:NnrU family protein n=1 Tax=Sulfitobacter sp. F26204 TaxID=2996014 RepID=UPI00225E5C4C|nr:NnrU family protein [Sulfitobacter sp. F26204]MCX7560186.1 NnrU family protein [Sulfitobacter sp. F26204]